MTRGVFTRFVSLMIYIGIWQDLFEYRIGNPITINLARFFTLLSNFTQLRVEYLSNGSKEKEKVEEEGGGGERETKEENSITTFRPGSDSNNYKQETLRDYLARNEVKNGATAATNFSPN